MASTAMVTISVGSACGNGLFLADFDHLTAFVLAAVRAGAVGKLLLVAVRAVGQAWRRQVIVRAAGGGTLL